MSAATGTDAVREIVRLGPSVIEPPTPQANGNGMHTGTPEADAGPVGFRGAAIAKLILTRARDPWISLQLGGDALLEVRLGGIVIENGGTGSGKTSLAASLLIDHAYNVGPAIAMSLELPADELGARVIGIRCDSSWPQVLRGEVHRGDMERAIPERFVAIERRDATLANLELWIDVLRAEHPEQPILIAIDYVQLIESEEREIRRKVADAMARIDKLARDKRVVVIVVSQTSRVASNQLRSGERLGAETTDAGAEAAELERWATATIAIGGHPSAEPGIDSCLVPISIGKSRMGGGDKVRMGRYCGRSGKWLLEGEARPAAEVRAESATKLNETKVNAARLAMIAHAGKSKESLTRADLIRVAAAGKAVGGAALISALETSDLVEVRFKKKRAPCWQIWTRARAEAAAVGIIEGGSL